MLFTFWVVLFNIFEVVFCGDEKDELLLLHVIFRHGERTPSIMSRYKTDPYANETYFPIGRGELTNKGKIQLYDLGQDLRFNYNDFLGDIYTPGSLYAITSSTNRTKMSLQTLLAGLYPPQESEIIVPGLLWQPIPFDHYPTYNDNFFVFEKCDRFQELFTNLTANFNYSENQDILNYLTKHSGFFVKTTYDALSLCTQLTIQSKIGHKLPPWSRKVYPDTLLNMFFNFIRFCNKHSDLRKMFPGNLLRTIVDTTQAKLNEANERKLYLYSGHANNLMMFLHLFELELKMPPFASYFAFEVISRNNTPGFRILYQDYNKSEPKIIQIPNCGYFCPVHKFINIFKHVLPNNIIKC